MKTDTTGVRLAAALLSVLSTVAACGGDDEGGGNGGSGGATGGVGGATGGSGGASGGSGGSGGSTGGAAGSGGSTGGASGSGGASGGSGGASGGSGGASGGSGGASGGSGGASGGSGGGGSQLTSVATVTGAHMAQDNTNLYVAGKGGVKKVVKSSGAVSDLFTLAGSGPECSMVAVNGSTVVATCMAAPSPLPKAVLYRVPTSGGTPTEAYAAAMGSMNLGGLTTDGFNGTAPGPNAYFHDGNKLMKIPAAAGAATTLGTATSTDLSKSSKYATLDSGAYYVVGSYNALSVPLSGGTVTTVLGSSGPPVGLHADGTNVYFVDGSWLWKVPKGGGTKVQVTPSGSLFAACNFGVHPDGTFVYGTDAGPSGSMAVRKQSLGGGASTTVATGSAASSTLDTVLVDNTSVWVLTQTGIFKAPK